MNVSDPYFHLTAVQTIKLRVLVASRSRGYSVNYWLKIHNLCAVRKKMSNPGPWRISYGVLYRFARMLGMNTDQLYKELNR